jgi:hypothetical protein
MTGWKSGASKIAIETPGGVGTESVSYYDALAMYRRDILIPFGFCRC